MPVTRRKKRTTDIGARMEVDNDENEPKDAATSRVRGF